MSVTNPRFATPDDGGQRIIVTDEFPGGFPDTPGNAQFDEFLASGVTAAPYVEPPPDTAAEFQRADRNMARIGEDVIVALIEKGTLAKADFEQEVIDKLNARRALRGLAEL